MELIHQSPLNGWALRGTGRLNPGLTLTCPNLSELQILLVKRKNLENFSNNPQSSKIGAVLVYLVVLSKLNKALQAGVKTRIKVTRLALAG